MNKTINIIAAVDEQFGFGKDGKIPWHYPEDFKFFQKMTKGHIVIMGRKTYEDLLTYKKGDTLLPNRHCIVVTSNPDIPTHDADGIRGVTLEAGKPEPTLHWAKTISDALNISRLLPGDVFFIGGESIFKSGLNMADCVYLTFVPGNHGCDRFFPMDKLKENFQIYNMRDGQDGLRFKTYVHNIWGEINPTNLG
jgi:dihydrofolate reductase